MSAKGARWRDSADDRRMVAWVKDCSSRLARHGGNGAYVNFISEREGHEVDAYASDHERLSRVKALYDPDNFFRMNQNVSPARSMPD